MMHYRPEIDGLRAVAVVPVILFHAGFSAFAGGYVGVDVFFVISGYLITTILIGEREAGTYSLLGFYERRARRILPALFLVLLCTIPFAWRWLAPDPFEDYARSQAFAALFLSNFHFLEKSSYYDIGSALRPLLHTWSLAVEEQFYLLFPLVLLPLGLFARRKFLVTFLILSALSLALAEWGWRTYPGENFYFTFSRLWELLAGSICAVILFGRKQMRSDIMGLTGLALIIYSIFFYNEAVPFPSVYTLVPVVGSMLIILFADRGTWTARALSAPPIVWIGLISYSAYLWHQPLFAFARIRSIGEPSLWLMSALSVATLVLAYLTMRYVETPFRRRTMLPGRNGLLTVSAAGIAAVAAFGFVGDATGGFPSRLQLQTPGMLTDLRDQLFKAAPVSGCIDGAKSGEERLCTVYRGDPPSPKIAVLGDSHGQAMMPGFAMLSNVHGVEVLTAARGACPPLLGVYLAKGGDYARECHDFVQGAAQDIVDQGIGTVYLVARWSLYTTGEYADDKATYALSDSFGARHVRSRERIATFESALSRTLEFYQKAGVRVVLVGQVPLQLVMAQTMIEQAMLMGLDPGQSGDKFTNSYVPRSMNDALVEGADDILRRIAAQHGADVLMLADHFAEADRYVWIRDGKVLYRDTNHLSVGGALDLAPRFAQSYAPR
ncbi:acyltransferase family protein [Roseovarius sp. M141]|uniref:acyltransferase family protein n=1 Tax=Roseovarius sp. M141 TaxID=2583806 RepID=UPI0020CC46E6|nr:acyltransferase family protein [Roseovarius sp. M141]MCQ0093045.1 acyltransferase [Roseovarius sp. M141]